MSVTFTNLDTNSSTANQTTPYSSASITPTANQPLLVSLAVSVGTSPTPVMTISGCNLTWTAVVDNTPASRDNYLFLGIGASPTTGVLSLNGDGVITVTSALWSVVQCAGVDTTTNNGVVQFIQAKPGANTSCSVAFTNTVNAANGTFAGVHIASQENPSAGSGWTGTPTNVAAPIGGLIGEWASTAQQNITASWVASVTNFIVGCELKAASAAAVTGQRHVANRARYRASNF